jgi:DNA topoisomerase II
MWVIDKNSGLFVLKTVEFVPALYKIFDEILVNAADNKIRDDTMNKIKVDIDQGSFINNNRKWRNISMEQWKW